LLTQRHLASRYQGSILGKAWNIFFPLINLSVYTFVFGVVYEGSFGIDENESSIQYALGIFLGLNFLSFFNESLSVSVGQIVGNPNYVKKIVFPLEVLPVSLIGANLITFMISMTLSMIGILVLSNSFTPYALWLPVIFIPILIFAQGTAWLFAALGVFYRDLNPLIQVVTMVMLWMSGIFYSANALPENAWTFLRFNPILLAVENSRNVLLWNLEPNLIWIAYTFAISIFTFFAGFFIFRSLKPAFADVI